MVVSHVRVLLFANLELLISLTTQFIKDLIGFCLVCFQTVLYISIHTLSSFLDIILKPNLFVFVLALPSSESFFGIDRHGWSEYTLNQLNDPSCSMYF